MSTNDKENLNGTNNHNVSNQNHNSHSTNNLNTNNLNINNPTNTNISDTELHTLSANPGYVLSQMTKAVNTSETHKDAEIRGRAQKKINDGLQVFRGMLSGILNIGSRTPVAGMPKWVTLEVAKGGFATGNALASGPLQEHEKELFNNLSINNFPINAAQLNTTINREDINDLNPDRSALNNYFLSEVGIQQLSTMLKNGCYRINLPEEGALMMIVWLLEHEKFEPAQALLNELLPFFSKLRFYPVPHAQPLSDNATVYLQTVSQTIQELEQIHLSIERQKQKEAIDIWIPLYDRAVQLFVETVAGPMPILSTDDQGKPIKNAAGHLQIIGGWPCQNYAEGWRERAQILLKDYQKARSVHQLCAKPEEHSESFARLRAYLKQCIKDPRQLSGYDVGSIRSILGAINVKRGLPTSTRCQQLRQQQINQVGGPTKVELARMLIERLRVFPKDQGLTDLDQAIAPITKQEADKFNLINGYKFPAELIEKAGRCLAAPLDVLIDKGIISSGEVLANVIPQITAQVRAANIEDNDLRRLYRAIDAAFCRRRSLLLLNLASQVKLTELPWIKAIAHYRKKDLTAQQAAQQQAKQTLEQIVLLAIKAFPYQILPNKLLQEIRSLADSAGLKLPIVDEVAADIFMGTFSEKFLYAAQKAATMMTGTLYEKYYGISYAKVKEIDDVTPSHYGAATSTAFIQLCRDMSDAWSGSWSVASNGKIIEQCQILTTHNLAVLIDGLNLMPHLADHLASLVRNCFQWICQQHQIKVDLWQARLRIIKNSAYAWRQMIFFLSLMAADDVEQFFNWAFAHLSKQQPEYQICFRPALESLYWRSKGIAPKEQFEQTNSVHRFLGWTIKKHWLM